MRKILTILTLSFGFISFNSIGLLSQELNNNIVLESVKDEKKVNRISISY